MALVLDQTYYKKGFKRLVGCDEAGRGPLAGPVVACCVMLPHSFSHPLINDSKQLTERQRELLYPLIMQEALAYSITVIDAPTIDQINILEASRLAMKQSCEKLTIPYDVVITDAMAFELPNVPVFPHIKGDSLSLTIAAASILAKVTRDRLMIALDQTYPGYGFAQHKGYPTASHRRVLETLPPIKGVHRFTFGPVKDVLK